MEAYSLALDQSCPVLRSGAMTFLLTAKWSLRCLVAARLTRRALQCLGALGVLVVVVATTAAAVAMVIVTTTAAVFTVISVISVVAVMTVVMTAVTALAPRKRRGPLPTLTPTRTASTWRHSPPWQQHRCRYRRWRRWRRCPVSGSRSGPGLLHSPPRRSTTTSTATKTTTTKIRRKNATRMGQQALLVRLPGRRTCGWG